MVLHCLWVIVARVRGELFLSSCGDMSYVVSTCVHTDVESSCCVSLKNKNCFVGATSYKDVLF